MRVGAKHSKHLEYTIMYGVLVHMASRPVGKVYAPVHKHDAGK